MLNIRFIGLSALLIAILSSVLLYLFDTGFCQPPKGSAEAKTTDLGSIKGAAQDKIVHQGVEVQFSIESASQMALMEGDFATIKFSIRDETTRMPLSALRPSVWIDLEKRIDEKLSPLSCKDKIGLYLQGTLGYRPDIDLNSYFILSLNNDGSLSVTDPIVSFSGITQLFGMIYLKRPGEDWVSSRDEKKLFVTVPKAGHVAAIDLERFKLIKEIEAGDDPFRIALQPDGRYLWVGNNSRERGKSGVTVIDAEELKPVTFILTGEGHHEIVFSEDSLFAFITNRKEGTLSVIDVKTLKKIKDLPVGKEPVSIAYSSLSKSVYIANEGDGTLTAVDSEKHGLMHRFPLTPGLRFVRFAPGGRYGLVVNGKEDTLEIFDASTHQVIHRVNVGREPDHIAFSKSHAYIRLKGAPEVALIQLSFLERGGVLPVLRVPIGQGAPGASPHHSVADPVVPTPEEGHALIVNPTDKMVYYYMEGMSGPMGSFRSYGGYVQKAVRVVDRSIREIAQGVYASQIRIPASGKYQVAFLLDSPRILHCFEFSSKPNPQMAKQRSTGFRIDMLNPEANLIVGKAYHLRFKLIDRGKEDSVKQVKDVIVQTTLAPGIWREQYPARYKGDGVYEVIFKPPRQGTYYLTFGSASLRMGFSHAPYHVLQAKEEGSK
jgi:YVTN family beta-propeller protein